MDESEEATAGIYKAWLKPMGIFAQYDDYPALESYLERYNGPERAIGALFIGLTHNVCAKLMADSKVGEIKLEHLKEVLALGGE